MEEKHYIISIGSEYASGGSAVARAVARDLDIPCYGRHTVDRIMEQTGVSPALVELANRGIDVSGLRAASGYSSAPTKYTDLTERMVYLQKEVIRKLAERSSCVINGRCADYILRDRKDCLNIFVYAPEKFRLANVERELKVDEKKARQIIHENDENLHARYLQITGTDWGERHNRQMLIDCSLLGVNGTAKYIELLAEQFRRKIYG